jgi:putative phosphoesterase
MGDEILKRAQNVDEVWHAGDWGAIDVSKRLTDAGIQVRGVYGNIDGLDIRTIYPKDLVFTLESVTVFMTHIGGYPPRYTKRVKEILEKVQPQLYICGHSHICKITRDNHLNLIHFNPGAIGKHGFHKKRTMIAFSLDNGKIIDVKILEYDR